MSTSANSIDRRKLVFSAAVIATIGVAGSLIYTLMRPTPKADAAARRQVRRPRRSVNVTHDELMKEGPLPELVMGSANAPVTIIEYASMTCSHCANFHNNVLPALKEKYIDTGKVRLIFREFPLDERAALASMMARCAGGEKAMPLIGVLFAKQSDWATAKTDFLPKIFKYGQQVGMTQQAFNECSQNERLIKDIISIRDRANTTFGVNQTPTFFINGKKMDGATVEDFDKALGPLLKG
ncbi:MAG: DsbA family protein [Hyphomonadaceae bacterium]|nr:DsbA family protein [Hyphomonadaceae bacterium]